MKNLYLWIVITAVLFLLNGCAIIRPVAQVAGGVVGFAGKAASTAVKAAPAVLPFVL